MTLAKFVSVRFSYRHFSIDKLPCFDRCVVYRILHICLSVCRGAVANMLVTSCLDNVCRLWVETILPDDGLVDLEQFDPNASVDPKFHTHRHKKRFLQRLKTIR